MQPTNSHNYAFRTGFIEFLFFNISSANTPTHFLIRQYRERTTALPAGARKDFCFSHYPYDWSYMHMWLMLDGKVFMLA
jgi:hypothetical protein